MSDKETILQEAARLTSQDRNADYGPYTDEARKIAAGWSVIFGVEIPPRKVPLAMVWLKTVRECNKSKRDNRVDGAAYFHLADQIVDESAHAKPPETQQIGNDPEADFGIMPTVRIVPGAKHPTMGNLLECTKCTSTWRESDVSSCTCRKADDVRKESER